MRAWRQNDTAAAIGLLERSVALLPAGKRRAELLWELAVALRLAGRPLDADAALERSSRDARVAGSEQIAARVTAERTRVSLLAGEIDLADAAAASMSAITQLESAGDSRGVGRAQLNLASIHGIACDCRAQEAAAELAITHYAKAGFSPAACYASLASALYHGPLPVASALTRCAELLESVDDRMTEANLSVVLGGLHGLQGDLSEARRLLADARSIFTDLGQRAAVDTILDPHTIAIERWAGNIEEAARICRDNLDRLLAADDRAYASTRAVQLADLLLDLGQADQAERVPSACRRAGHSL